jgi:hypothetical protein
VRARGRAAYRWWKEVGGGRDAGWRRVQVLRLQVDAPGLAGRVCAPREVLLERMYLRQEEDNIHLVMFASKDEVEVRSGARRAGVHGRAARGRWGLALR